MELALTLHDQTQVEVTCDGQPSHHVDLTPLLLNDQDEEKLLSDPLDYGKRIYAALFPASSPAQQALMLAPERLVLILEGDQLDALPWEYAYGAYGDPDIDGQDTFLVLKCPVVRGLPAQRRLTTAPQPGDLHLIAVPSQPLSHHLPPLAIEEEWQRLKETIEGVPYAITLERTRPPTLERVRQLVTHPQQKSHVLHFMGHGGQHGTHGAILCLEKEHGELALVTAEQFMQRVRQSVFLVTLNACVSATPGPTAFSNLAAALVRRKTPYALGMRMSIHDDDARTFSRTFYSELARGSSVEEALFQTRLTLADASPRSGIIGVPVLYTALAEPVPGFHCREGIPTVKEHQPPLELNALPPVQGTFQGRIDELLTLGQALTADHRPRILTIHGSGGQGKTALARLAAERFAFTWPGGVWAATLEHLPTRSDLVNNLAHFLGIPTQETIDQQAIEAQVLARLAQRRTLLVLDNAETLIDAIARASSASSAATSDVASTPENSHIYALVEWIKRLAGPTISLLITSRSLLGWSDEQFIGLSGLSPEEGAALFIKCAPQRAHEIDAILARQLSQKLDGHPLSLRLLAGAFNASGSLTLSALIQTYETCLREAQDFYTDPTHRHRSLDACIETSVRFLSEPLRALLSGLWIFHAPFLAQSAAAIFNLDSQETEHAPSVIRDHLHTLWLRSLLTRRAYTMREGTVVLYSLLPTMRPYVEQHLEQVYARDALLARFGETYARLVRHLYDELNRQTTAVLLAQQADEDIERASTFLSGGEQGYYLVQWGYILYRLGYPLRGLQHLERALEIAQGTDQKLMLLTMNEQAIVYSQIGKPQEALALYEQALPIRREVGDRAGEATTLNNQALVYFDIGKPQEALALYEQALPIRRELGDRVGEATTLNNQAAVYSQIGKPQEALVLYAQALPILREVGDRAGEARTLNGIAYLYRNLQRYEEALTAFEASLQLTREISHVAGEIAGLVGIALLLYQHLDRPADAIRYMEQAIALLQATGLPQDAAGSTPERLQQYLSAMRQGASLEVNRASSTLPAASLLQLVGNTTAVMTEAKEHRAQWYEMMTKNVQLAQQRGADRQFEVELFTAILALLDGQPVALPANHPYAPVMATIQDHIEAWQKAQKEQPAAADQKEEQL